jgi:hypothetical protein
MRTGNTSRPAPLQLLRLITALGLIVCSLAQASAAWGQLPLPTPRPRTEQSLLDAVKNLLLYLLLNEPGTSVALARVVRADRSASSYRRFREEYPGADPDLIIGALGGRFQVIETLSGQPVPTWLEVSNKRESPKQNFITELMRLGEFWIVVYDHKTDTVKRQLGSGTFMLSGPDDILLAIYRRHVVWQNRPDYANVLREARAAILSAEEPAASRVGALYSLGRRIGKSGDLFRSADYPIFRRILVELLTQEHLPRDVQMAAFRLIHIDTTQEIAPGSDSVILLRYLLKVLATETDKEVVIEAGDKLCLTAAQSSSATGKYTVYYVPEIVAALERREQQDNAQSPIGRSPVSRFLYELQLSGRRRLEDIKDVPVVVRHLP